MSKNLLVLAALLAAPSLAAADTNVDGHLNVGFEGLVGDAAHSLGLRTHVGIDVPLGSAGLAPSIGVGATFGLASLGVDDTRALDGTVDVGHFDYGPELQLGLRWLDGGLTDTRVFLALAYLRVDVDDRLRMDPIDGVVSGSGWRAAIGGVWADRLARAAAEDMDRDTGRDDLTGLLVFLAPQQVEIVVEQTAGSTRTGVALSYGF